MKVIITGGQGFFGSHLMEEILKSTDWEVIVFDKMTYASNGFDRIRDISIFKENEHRVKFFAVDLAGGIPEGVAKEVGPDVDYIIHCAAETHVDRSIEDPEAFVTANVLATTKILQFARTQPKLKRFLYFSTDEVFGPAPEGTAYKEWDRYNSGNPYAAAKAGGEEMVLAFGNTYKLPVIITHTMNLCGERQHPEKFIPSVIRAAINGTKVTIHANPDKTKAGSRFYIHCRNAAKAILFLLESGEIQDKYNIVGEKEIDNLELALMLNNMVGNVTGVHRVLDYELVDFHSQRPGHDLRYALDGSKLKAMGFEYPKSLEESLQRTVEWYIRNPEWLEL